MTGKPLPPNAQRAEDRRALLAYLDDLADSGRPVPCRQAPSEQAAAWTSDDRDDQALAARLCVGCAGVTRCAEYGLRWPREVGTYGAMTESERQQAATPKEAA